MRKDEEKGRKKTQKPEAFKQFFKKTNPREEIKRLGREEKRRKEKAQGEDGAAETARPRKRITASGEAPPKRFERAGTSRPGKREDEPRNEGRGEGRGFGRGESRGEGRGFGRGESRGEGRGFGRGESRGEGRGFGRGESRGEGRGFGRGESRGEGRGFGRGESRGEGRGFGRGESRGEGRGFGRGESRGEGRGFGRGESRGEGRGFGRGESRGQGFRREGAPRFEGYQPQDQEGDFFERAWNDRKFKRAKSPEGKRKQAERTLAADLDSPIRLNRFIALSGVCSRRAADVLIEKGLVTVNGEVAKELGMKVQSGKDKVVCNGKELAIKQFIYLLMNKPKNMITTTEDEQGRQTVMDLVHKYTSVRVYPVGRLDRNTTGLLLFTNDGELAKKLTHPSHEFSKLYHVRLDKPVLEDHLALLRVGVELEDGVAAVDDIEYVEGAGRNEVGLKIHIGRNRIVRRMFEHLGYQVEMLDRAQYGPLNKQGLPRGTCRLLSDAEVGFLKMLK